LQIDRKDALFSTSITIRSALKILKNLCLKTNRKERPMIHILNLTFLWKKI